MSCSEPIRRRTLSQVDVLARHARIEDRDAFAELRKQVLRMNDAAWWVEHKNDAATMLAQDIELWDCGKPRKPVDFGSKRLDVPCSEEAYLRFKKKDAFRHPLLMSCYRSRFAGGSRMASRFNVGFGRGGYLLLLPNLRWRSGV